MNRFRDYSGAKRSAIHCAWHPDGGRALVVAHANLTFQSASNVTECYTWNVENSNKPEAILRPPSMALCLEYNPKDSHVILGGLHSGQVGFNSNRTLCQVHELFTYVSVGVHLGRAQE